MEGGGEIYLNLQVFCVVNIYQLKKKFMKDAKYSKIKKMVKLLSSSFITKSLSSHIKVEIRSKTTFGSKFSSSYCKIHLPSSHLNLVF